MRKYLWVLLLLPLLASGAPVVTSSIRPGPWATPTLASNWTNWGGGWAPAGYYKDGAGTVHLRGLLNRSTTTSSFGKTNCPIFTLPAGYRPAYIMSYLAFGGGTEAGGYVATVRVDPDGTVYLNSHINSVQANAISAGNPLFLDGFSFRAEQ